MIYQFQDKTPDTGKAAFVAGSADIVGDVTLGEDVTVWPNAAIRGDLAPVLVGKGTNIQEGVVVHVDHGVPCIIGDNVTVGHGAIVHGAKVGNGCLIGMGAILLNNCEIGEDSVVGAGALVTEGKVFPPGSLVVGAPARLNRKLTAADIENLKKSSEGYIELGKELAAGLRSAPDNASD